MLLTRRMNACLCVGAVTLVGLMLSGATAASTSFYFASDQANYVANPGESIVVTLYLVEERSSEADASVLVADDGIFGFDVKVDRQSGLASIVAAAANSSVFAMPIMTTYQPTLPLPAEGVSTIEFVLSALDDPGPTGTLDGLLRRVMLGTITIEAPMTVGELSTFAILDSPIGTNTITNGFTILDTQTAAGGFTLQTIPEPAGLVIIALLGPALLTRRLRELR